MYVICNHVLLIGTSSSITNNLRVERLAGEGLSSCRKQQVMIVFDDADDDDSN